MNFGSAKGQRAMLRRAKLGLPTVVSACAFFFLAGLYGSLLFRTPDPVLEKRRMTMEVVAQPVDGIEHGESGEDMATPVLFQVLSWKPRALYFPNFATAEQCESIIKMAKAKLAPSKLALREGETHENTQGIRTSTGTFLSAAADQTGLLNEIEKNIARVTMLPKENGEAFNVLRYEIGQKYSSHYDAFNPVEYGPQTSQRIASFLLYLSDVEEGGETMFPYENGLMDERYDFEKCIGLKIKPHKGDGLLFYSLTANGTIDPYSLHGSCPVIKGEKWVATKWIRTIDAGDGM